MSNTETIFVAMASQDDEETKYAIKHAFENAKNPERVYVGVGLTCSKAKHKKEIEQIVKQNQNVSMHYVKQRKNSLKTIGIGQGRTRAANLYKNQDYMLQVDCHSFFDDDWDEKMINMFNEAKKEVGDNNFVLSCIPLIYTYDKEDNVVKEDLPKTRYGTYVMDEFFVEVVPRWTESDIFSLYPNQFLPAHKLNPACTFGNKKFAENPGIHYEAIFYDEDWTQQLNLIERDFAFVFPSFEDFPIRHLDGSYCTPGHERAFLTDYLTKNKSNEMHENLKNNYLKFVTDSSRVNSVNKYYRYSKAHAVKGYFSASSKPFPKSYRIEK